jgi:hypothetical protein
VATGYEDSHAVANRSRSTRHVSRSQRAVTTSSPHRCTGAHVGMCRVATTGPQRPRRVSATGPQWSGSPRVGGRTSPHQAPRGEGGAAGTGSFSFVSTLPFYPSSANRETSRRSEAGWTTAKHGETLSSDRTSHIFFRRRGPCIRPRFEPAFIYRKISARSCIHGYNQYLVTISTGRNIYSCPCLSGFGRVSDIRRI